MTRGKITLIEIDHDILAISDEWLDIAGYQDRRHGFCWLIPILGTVKHSTNHVCEQCVYARIAQQINPAKSYRHIITLHKCKRKNQNENDFVTWIVMAAFLCRINCFLCRFPLIHRCKTQILWICSECRRVCNNACWLSRRNTWRTTKRSSHRFSFVTPIQFLQC